MAMQEPATRRHRCIVVDVGTHAGQEALLLSSMRRPHIIKTYLALTTSRRRPRPIASFSTIRRMLDLKRRINRFDLTFVFVEPLLWPSFTKHLGEFPGCILFTGVTSMRPPGTTTLFLSKSHLGHSIFSTKPGLSGTTVEARNFQFSVLMESLEALYGIDRDQDLLVLRINAEGVERELLDYVCRRDDHPIFDLIFGSLGDVKKVFGDEAHTDLTDLLTDHDLSVTYFASTPSSWLPALESFANALEERVIPVAPPTGTSG